MVLLVFGPTSNNDSGMFRVVSLPLDPTVTGYGSQNQSRLYCHIPTFTMGRWKIESILGF